MSNPWIRNQRFRCPTCNEFVRKYEEEQCEACRESDKKISEADKYRMQQPVRENSNDYCGCGKLKESLKAKACLVCLKRISLDRRAKASAKYREKLKEDIYEYRDGIKAEVWKYYGEKCACCGETRAWALQLDHKYNDGARRRAEGEAIGHALYKDLVTNGFSNDFQLLCGTCNWGKSRNYGVCPHEEERKTVEVLTSQEGQVVI
jgi:hypothetical protein